MCLCSTIFSIAVVVTLLFDLITTPNFANSGKPRNTCDFRVAEVHLA